MYVDYSEWLVGTFGLFRIFLKLNFSELLKKSKTKFQWTDEATVAFEKLKIALTSSPILTTPDYALPFTIQTDASDVGLGAVLTQTIDDKKRVIAYMSTKLSATQKKYHVTECECLAVITAIEKFRPYVEGVHFTVITDHASLLWLQGLKDPTGRLARWALRLQAYDFTMFHRKGKLNVVPDALSRAVETIDVSRFAESEDEWYLKLKDRIDNPTVDHSEYFSKQNVVYKFIKPSRISGSGCWKICVPLKSRSDVIKECHDDLLAAHGGYFKTLARIRQQYFWLKMANDTHSYVRACGICKTTKSPNVCQQSTMGEYCDPKQPWRMIALG